MFRFWYSILSLYYELIYFFYERPKGLDFCRMYDPYGTSSDNIFYQTKSYGQLCKIMEGYVDPYARLLDVGCGKGHFLYSARRMGFTNVDGIEFSSRLLNIAKSNISALGLGGVRLMQADAAEFQTLDLYDIIYLYNPFCTGVMRRFVRNLERSLERNPRPLRVIYANPAEHHVWARSDYFKLTKTRKLVQLPRTISVYYYLHDPYEYEKKRLEGSLKESFKDVLDQNIYY
jgi:SAM-dependent methyltransferase